MHLIKLAVGVDRAEELVAWQARRLETLRRAGQPAELVHRTRHMPKKRLEVLEGGSLYWVIKGVVQLRQRIADLREEADGEGRPLCGIVFDPVLVPVRPQARRPFQGWRYLTPADAPPDLATIPGSGHEAMPPALRAELAALALL